MTSSANAWLGLLAISAGRLLLLLGGQSWPLDVPETNFGNMMQVADIDGANHGHDVRAPTVTEAAEWLKKMEHSPEYCRTCLTHWKRVMGVSAARQVFDQAPESVRKWINERKA